MITRRTFVRGVGAFALSGLALGGYAVAEPWRLNVTRYAPALPAWPASLKLRIAVIADIHACEPWMPAFRVSATTIVDSVDE